jgi:hypothetical protein
MKTIIAAGSDRQIKEMEDNLVRGFAQLSSYTCPVMAPV